MCMPLGIIEREFFLIIRLLKIGNFKKIVTVYKIILKNNHILKKFKNQPCKKFLTKLFPSVRNFSLVLT